MTNLFEGKSSVRRLYRDDCILISMDEALCTGTGDLDIKDFWHIQLMIYLLQPFLWINHEEIQTSCLKVTASQRGEQ